MSKNSFFDNNLFWRDHQIRINKIANTFKLQEPLYWNNNFEFTLNSIAEHVNRINNFTNQYNFISALTTSISQNLIPDYIENFSKAIISLSNVFSSYEFFDDEIIISDELAESYNSVVELIKDKEFNEALKSNGYELTPIKAKERITLETKRFIIEIAFALFIGFVGAMPGYVEMFKPDEPKTVIDESIHITEDSFNETHNTFDISVNIGDSVFVVDESAGDKILMITKSINDIISMIRDSAGEGLNVSLGDGKPPIETVEPEKHNPNDSQDTQLK